MALMVFKTRSDGSPLDLPVSVKALGAPREFWPHVVKDVLDSPLSKTLLHITGFHIHADVVTLDILVPDSVEDVDAFRIEAREAVHRLLAEAAWTRRKAGA